MVTSMLRPVNRLPLTLIVLACLGQGGAAAASVPSPPAGAVPGLQSRARSLPAATLVAEAVDHTGLARTLDRGRYTAGSEREFFGRGATFNHVTERVLRFGNAAGAARYLLWLRAHASELLGAPRSVTALAPGTDGFTFRPKGCGCHSDTPTYLIAWRRGNDALTVLASGPGSTAKTAGALARSLARATS